jgi:Uncharacterized alpha/beta hydrolase domain (DUF2235)
MNPITLQTVNRDVKKQPPGPFQDCRDTVHLAFFFDGTGNNMAADDEKRKWSNVARMFMSARQEPSNAIYPIYIAGVGTRFNGDVGAARSAWTWVQDNTLGNALGMGGDQRMDLGEEQMNDRLRSALLSLAKQSNDEVKKFAQANQDKSFNELNNALSKHRLIKFINISVFGFSRGAALARAFTNRLVEKFDSDGKGNYTLEGYPVRVVFQGIFDTVASFGLPRKNLTAPWGERDLKLPSILEQCVHFVAGHEVRYAFPLDLVRENGQYKGNIIEKVYPGVHSDVGGGYEPDKQARSDNLARVPLCDMQQLAVQGGTRVRSLEELKTTRAAIYQRFEVTPETHIAYKNYCKAVGNLAGPIESQIRKHMEVFYAAQGTLNRKGNSLSDKANKEKLAAAQDEFKLAQRKADYWGKRNPRSKAEADEMSADYANYREAQQRLIAAKTDAERLENGQNNISAEAIALERAIEQGAIFTSAKGNLMITLTPHRWMLDAWRTNLAEPVCDFFEQYIHDSRTDFLGGAEPFAYFNNRGIHEQTRPVISEAELNERKLSFEDRAKAARARDREKAGIRNYKE